MVPLRKITPKEDNQSLKYLPNVMVVEFKNVRGPFGNLGIDIGKYKPSELKIASTNFLSNYSRAYNMYSCNVSWQYLILLKPSTFDYVPVSEMSRSSEQYCT